MMARPAVVEATISPSEKQRRPIGDADDVVERHEAKRSTTTPQSSQTRRCAAVMWRVYMEIRIVYICYRRHTNRHRQTAVLLGPPQTHRSSRSTTM
jgi:hypothetical protein